MKVWMSSVWESALIIAHPVMMPCAAVVEMIEDLVEARGGKDKGWAEDLPVAGEG